MPTRPANGLSGRQSPEGAGQSITMRTCRVADEAPIRDALPTIFVMN